MNSIEKVRQMAHLKQSKISDNSCKAIIIDTLLDAIMPQTKKELLEEILSVYHVLISSDRLDQMLTLLSNDRIIHIDDTDHITIEPIYKAEFISARQREVELRNNAVKKWLEYLKSTENITNELENSLSLVLPVFLRTLFVKHGVKSYELLSSINDDYIVDVKQIAEEVAKKSGLHSEKTIAEYLPTIFQDSTDAVVMDYLVHSIKKAVGYISEVISEDTLSYLTESLRHLVLYLDTNIIYRLLHWQGDSRFKSIKETLSFCKQNKVKLKISATTKRELSARINYDSRVLLKYPVKTNLVKAGYKYRTSENFVSTFWEQTLKSGISAADFIQYYKNFDVLLQEEGIEVEDIEVDEAGLIEIAKRIYGKMSQRDPNYEKNDSSLWHDAYSLAYVQKMQRIDAQNAIDTGCLFLTTDQSITSLQREDPLFKDRQVVALSPSQFLQMFGFTKPDSGYEETFVKYFASSSMGISFDYSNNDIQEILSRISHYEGVNPIVAERILARELIDQGYKGTSSDEKKEEIVYNSISEELLSDLEMTKQELDSQRANGANQAEEIRKIRDALESNKTQHAQELQKLKNETERIELQLEKESSARERAEEEAARNSEKNQRQLNHHIKAELRKWRTKKIVLFWIGLLSTVGVLIVSIIMCAKSGFTYLGLLTILTLTVPIMLSGTSAFSASERNKAREAMIEEYERELDEGKSW